jgi:hypothetical protein
METVRIPLAVRLPGGAFSFMQYEHGLSKIALSRFAAAKHR